MILEYGALGLGQRGQSVAQSRGRTDAVAVEVDQPDVVGYAEVLLVEQERGRDADDEGRGREEQLLGAAHAGRQERDRREHVLQRVDHRHEGHDRHRQGVVVARLQEHLSGREGHGVFRRWARLCCAFLDK